MPPRWPVIVFTSPKGRTGPKQTDTHEFKHPLAVCMQHIEQHSSGSDNVCDVVTGMADGLTVRFAPAASISGALSCSHRIDTVGQACPKCGRIALPRVPEAAGLRLRTPTLRRCIGINFDEATFAADASCYLASRLNWLNKTTQLPSADFQMHCVCPASR